MSPVDVGGPAVAFAKGASISPGSGNTAGRLTAGARPPRTRRPLQFANTDLP